MIKRIEAIFFLAWQLVALLWEKTSDRFARQARGKKLFLQNYQDDGLYALTPTQRACANQQGDCFHCGLCEAIFVKHPELLTHPPTQTPQTLFVGASRDLTSIHWVQSNQDWSQSGYTNLTRDLSNLCPAGLSFSTMQQLYIGIAPQQSTDPTSEHRIETGKKAKETIIEKDRTG